MKKQIMTAALSLGMLFGTALPGTAAVARHHYSRSHYSRSRYIRHRRHMKTLKRVGIGTAGGAVAGALIGGGPGAVVGGVAGAGAGALYDRHEKHHGHN